MDAHTAPAEEVAPVYLTKTEAAAYLRVCTRSFERWLTAGKVPAIRQPGVRRLLFRKEDLDRLLNEALDGGA